MKLIDKIKLILIKHKYNKMIDEQAKRHKEMEKASRDFLIEEIDRRLERSQELVETYKKVFNN